MGLSLQEQLLKAGVVDKKQIKKAEHEKRIQNKKKKKGKGQLPENKAKLLLQQQQAEQAKQDQKLNAQRMEQEKLKAERAAAKQLIEQNRKPLESGDEAYRYVDAGKIRTVYLQTEIADKLSAGKLAVAKYNADLVLIPAETAIKVLQRDESAVLIYNDPATVDDYPDEW
jgi:uncharacterized protein YaiL (DUF2058 family)